MPKKVETAWSFLKFIWRNFKEDNCRQNAAALTYMSLFAVVPLMTVLFTVIASIQVFGGFEQQIQNFIFEHFVPTSGTEVKDYFVRFVEQTRSLSGVGIVFLAVTAFLMLKNIETAFNHIWQVERGRHGINGFLLYWAVLSLGPILLGAAFAIRTYLVSLSVLFESADVTGLGTSLLKLVPFLMTAAAFTLLFAAVPNCKVPFRHALYGGLTTAIAFELAKFLFTTLIRNSSYQVVYGAFATIPLLLLWLHLSWQLLLAGAELVFALTHFSSDSDTPKEPTLLLLELLEQLHNKHVLGESLSPSHIRSQFYDNQRIPVAQWEKLRKVILSRHLAHLTEDGNLVLGRDLQQVTLWQLLEWNKPSSTLIHTAEKLSHSDKHPDWLPQFSSLLANAIKQNQMNLSTSIAELLAVSAGSDINPNPATREMPDGR